MSDDNTVTLDIAFPLLLPIDEKGEFLTEKDEKLFFSQICNNIIEEFWDGLDDDETDYDMIPSSLLSDSLKVSLISENEKRTVFDINVAFFMSMHSIEIENGKDLNDDQIDEIITAATSLLNDMYFDIYKNFKIPTEQNNDGKIDAMIDDIISRLYNIEFSHIFDNDPTYKKNRSGFIFKVFFQ